MNLFMFLSIKFALLNMNMQVLVSSKTVRADYESSYKTFICSIDSHFTYYSSFKNQQSTQWIKDWRFDNLEINILTDRRSDTDRTSYRRYPILKLGLAPQLKEHNMHSCLHHFLAVSILLRYPPRTPPFDVRVPKLFLKFF